MKPVSTWLNSSRAAFALLCLVAAQLVLASCGHEEMAMGAARVTLGGN